MERETKEDLKLVGLGFVWGALVLNLAHTIGGNLRDDTAEKVADTQAYNEQIEQQLSDGYRNLHKLVLDTDDEFDFEFTNDAGETVICKGTYEIQEETAQAVGDLACTNFYEIDKEK